MQVAAAGMINTIATPHLSESFTYRATYTSQLLPYPTVGDDNAVLLTHIHQQLHEFGYPAKVNYMITST